MPSPFPGMDPYIEMQEWETFHASFIIDIADALSAQAKPGYYVRCQYRVYVEHESAEMPRPVVPDATVLVTAGRRHRPARQPRRGSPAVAKTPVERDLPMPETRREVYLMIHERVTREVVTVLELLSPGNKRAKSNGRRKYLKKRDEVLQSAAHLVELDLLRGGLRLPMRQDLPPAEYYAIVSRAERRPRAEVYAWTLQEPLTAIPVPLAGNDPEILLDLQSLFTARYDRSAYGDSLDYSAEIHPPLSAADAEWVRQIVQR